MDKAFRRRDESYDGIFFVAVRTTAIFCRPSCPARKPLARNVEFFATAREALFSGYRPCKRCRPMHTNGRPPEWAERLIKQVERAPSKRYRDADLRSMSIDPARARRFFKRQYGMTFQAYSRARRMGDALTQIRRGADLTAVALGHGYDSNSGFRDAFEKTFGRAPGKSRDADCVVTRTLESPIGPLIVCASSNAVCLVEFTDRRSLEREVGALRRRLGCAIVPGSNEHIERLTRELERYFAGRLQKFTVAIDAAGTPFQRVVWEQLLAIPYGQTVSYEKLALNVGRRGAQRAVGRANGENPLAIVIPCHRVVNKNGQLGGYGGGLWRKQFLLDLEGGVAGKRNGQGLLFQQGHRTTR
jgi:AraC family transcriptional regulator of adaptative response/methylated-DNA-[protein]-cysteine methyltransferase